MARLGCLSLLLVFTACGGSEVPQVQPSDELSNLQALASVQLAELVDLSFTPLSELPQSGRAQYNGILEAQLDQSSRPENNIIGQLDIFVTFNQSGAEVSGALRSVFALDGRSLDGFLTVASGSLDKSVNPTVDHTLSIGLQGQLSDPESRPTSFALRLEGDFYGPLGGYAGGIVFGRAENQAVRRSVLGRFTVKD